MEDMIIMVDEVNVNEDQNVEDDVLQNTQYSNDYK